MSLDPALVAMCTETVTLSSGTPTHDRYGAEAWTGAGTSYPAHLTLSNYEVRADTGERIPVAGTVWIASTAAILTAGEQRLQLSDGSFPPIQRIEAFYDQDGRHHTKIMVGR